MPDLESEIRRRRTFAIISHPDAGKTTITEKILYEGGVIQQAGEVRGKAGTKAATSDWMKLEQQRGISITSSAMSFDYNQLRVNLLDTPGHKDFGEDTYRTLIAADSAAMLIDCAKGVETQTRKLYEVCRLRKMPIFTFANKMDREGKAPLELIDDVESTLKMNVYPVTWPIGIGAEFKGLYHRLEKRLYLYERGRIEPEVVAVSGPDDPQIRQRVGDEIYARFKEEIDLMEGVLGPVDDKKFLAGEVTLMTFGSAKFNWGVDLFLNLFTQYAPGPQPRQSKTGQNVEPTDSAFSGFVFKIQANMDKRHRDRVAFLRVCSGQFERGMKVWHTRLGRELRLAYANQFLAQDRETVDTAFAGDIVGVTDTGNFQIGDTVTMGAKMEFGGIPRFSPEYFAKLNVKDAIKRKQLEKAIFQLVDEGSIQMFCDPKVGWQDPILGVVGVLQFEVMQFRLQDEYGLETRLDMMPYKLARWPRAADGSAWKGPVQDATRVFIDRSEQPVLLFDGDWNFDWVRRKNPELEFSLVGA